MSESLVVFHALRSAYVRAASIETPDLWPLLGQDAAARLEPRVDLSLSNRTLHIEGDTFEVTLETTLTGTWNGHGVYRARVSRACLFALATGLADEARRRVLNVACSEALFAGAIELAVGLIRAAGFPAPRVPAVAFESVYARGARAHPDESRVAPLREFWGAHTRLGRAIELGLAEVDSRPIAALALAVTAAARRAVPAADELLRPLPAEPWVLEAMGAVYVMNNAYGRAAEVYRRTAREWSDSARAHYNLGTSLMFVGELDEAAQEIQRCLACDAAFWDAYALQTKLRGHGGIPTDRLATLGELLQRHGPERMARQRLHMAMAVDCEGRSDYPAAFEHFRAGNAAQREGTAYDTHDDAKIFEALEDRVPKIDASVGCQDDAPIFIIGMPRSGTTLVERILSAHRDVAAAGELKQFPLLVKCMSGSLTRSLLDAETIERARGLDWRALGEHYLREARPVGAQAARFTDKFPHNFLYVPYLSAALPRARIVCVQRGAMDTCLGNFREEFASDSGFHAYASNLPDIARYYVMYARLMARWHALFGGRMLVVRYEQLTADPEAVTRQMLAFCGLPWDSDCLRFEANPAAVATASAVQVRRPIHRDAIGRWKHYADELAGVGNVLRDAGIALD
ncbi:MAG TPA: protein-export chaperone SecB [Rhodanobacteraceae bacterium]|nr:protein-export chaperone SecB [Rhodanobacteraceae bacterium]